MGKLRRLMVVSLFALTVALAFFLSDSPEADKVEETPPETDGNNMQIEVISPGEKETDDEDDDSQQ
ncbi:hypothetical protein [Virgibacillus sediminis]|uniref:Secreted protein n=1 Tax=Virgibacillus sediminis TaxID=202260 RepID=A0ABV7A967_9BACI